MKVNATLTSDRYKTVAITEQKLSDMITKASEDYGIPVDKLYDRHTHTYSRMTEQLPTFFLTLKAHKNPPGTRPIVATDSTAISAMSRLTSKVLSILIEVCAIVHANCSYVKTAYVDCGNKGGTIGHYYSHYKPMIFYLY
jgi:hypothetical protein